MALSFCTIRRHGPWPETTYQSSFSHQYTFLTPSCWSVWRFRSCSQLCLQDVSTYVTSILSPAIPARSSPASLISGMQCNPISSKCCLWADPVHRKLFTYLNGQHHIVEQKLHEKHVRTDPNSLSFSSLAARPLTLYLLIPEKAPETEPTEHSEKLPLSFRQRYQAHGPVPNMAWML